MKAVMLAAGRGNRLFGSEHDQDPKALLQFDGQTLLQRHLEVLRSAGIAELLLVTGYQSERIEAELRAIGADSFASTVFNPDFDRGAMVSLWCAREELRAGDDWLFMDADVLYHPDLIQRLLDAPSADCLLFDGHFEPGEDPVMICLSGGRLVEFGKQIPGRFERVGEWPGFLKMSGRTASLLADATERYVEAGDVMLPYEPAMRDVMLGSPSVTFSILDISDLPWIEIDFPEDLSRAIREILPQLKSG